MLSMILVMMGGAVIIAFFLFDNFMSWKQDEIEERRRPLNRARRKNLPPADMRSPDQKLVPQWLRENGKGREEMSQEEGLFARMARAFTGPAPAPTPMPTAAPALPRIEVDYEDDRIPGKAKDHVRKILACLKQVEELMDREQVPGFSRLDVEQMRDVHLPKLVKSYIDIPEEHRAEIFRKTGKSASYILCDSLEKMQAKIDEIMRNLAQHDIDAFTDNTRFIEERYTNSDPFA